MANWVDGDSSGSRPISGALLMGTNYYAYFRMNYQAREKIFNVIKPHLSLREQDTTERTLGLHVPGIDGVHIGKSSFGWEFLFNHNNFLYYSSTKSSITHFLLRPWIDFKNEYGDFVDIIEFWEMVHQKEGGRIHGEGPEFEDSLFSNVGSFKEHGLLFNNNGEFS